MITSRLNNTFVGVALSCALASNATAQAAAPPQGPASAEEPAVPPPELTGAPPADSTVQPSREDRCRAAGGRDVCRGERIGGAVLTGAGIAGLGLGFGLMFVPKQTLEPGRDLGYQPAGATLVGASIMVLATGAFLLADALQRQAGPKSRGSRSRRSRQ